VTIPSSIEVIGDSCFEDSGLKNISIEGSITAIGESAFQNTKISSFNFSPNLTSIGGYAFYNCYSLASIDISNSVESIGNYVFYNCSQLTSINIPYSVTSIGNYAFYNCGSLTSIDIPYGVTSIGERAFYNCSSLTSVNIPYFVMSIGDYAFSSCESLLSLDIPGVPTIGMNAFSYCPSITSINIEDDVRSIGSYAFYGCRSLSCLFYGGKSNPVCGDSVLGYTGINYNNPVHVDEDYNGNYFENKLVVKDGGVCPVSAPPSQAVSYNCYSYLICSESSDGKTLTVSNVGRFNDSYYDICSVGRGALVEKVIIEDGVYSLGREDFSYCYSLKSIEFGSDWNSISYDLFLNNELLASIEVSPNNGMYSSQDGVLFNKGKSTLILYPCAKENELYNIPDSVTSIGNFSFYKVRPLTSVNIPNSITSIGNGAFSYCSSLVCVSYNGMGMPNYGYSVFLNTGMNVSNPIHVREDYEDAKLAGVDVIKDGMFCNLTIESGSIPSVESYVSSTSITSSSIDLMIMMIVVVISVMI